MDKQIQIKLNELSRIQNDILESLRFIKDHYSGSSSFPVLWNNLVAAFRELGDMKIKTVTEF